MVYRDFRNHQRFHVQISVMQIAHNGDTQEAATEVISQYGVVSNMTCMCLSVHPDLLGDY